LNGEVLQDEVMFRDERCQCGFKVGVIAGPGKLFQVHRPVTQRAGTHHVTGAFETMGTALDRTNIASLYLGLKLLQIGDEGIDELLQNFTPQAVIVAKVF
jgi:hypothetical protein